MKKCFLLMMTAMMTATVLAQGDERKEIELTSEERALVNSNNQFAFDLFRKARGGEDMLLSPLSITYALGMVNNGAGLWPSRCRCHQRLLPQDADGSTCT